MSLRLPQWMLVIWLLLGPGMALAIDVNALLVQCAPDVHPETMKAVISAESRGNIYAVADAGPVALPWSQRKHLVRSHYPDNLPDAVRLVEKLLMKGHTVSLGLSQINDRNLARLGLSVVEVFTPCMNIAAGARILTEFYVDAVKKFGNGPRALRAALSAYNSGSFVRGEKDGYVNAVYRQAGRPLVLHSGLAKNTSGLREVKFQQKGWVGFGGGGKRGREDFTMEIRSFADGE